MLGWDEDKFVPIQIHLFAGCKPMLGAFFIATDPVTAATSQKVNCGTVPALAF